MDRNAVQGRTSDYARIAARYDATRHLPDDILLACHDRLRHAGVLPATGRVLDAGCGTGQASLPLAVLGFRVLGIDIAREMVSVARTKLRPDWQASYGVGDVRRLPLGDGGFDAVVVSKLFQHVQDWRQACRELIRVVRPGGCIVQVNERGAFGNAVRRCFARQADARGFRSRYPGLNPHAAGDGDLPAFMTSRGCTPVVVDTSDLRWAVSIRYGEALGRLREKLFAEFWYLPDAAYRDLLAATQAWVDAQPEGAETVQHLRPCLAVAVFRTPGNA